MLHRPERMPRAATLVGKNSHDTTRRGAAAVARVRRRRNRVWVVTNQAELVRGLHGQASAPSGCSSSTLPLHTMAACLALPGDSDRQQIADSS